MSVFSLTLLVPLSVRWRGDRGEVVVRNRALQNDGE